MLSTVSHCPLCAVILQIVPEGFQPDQDDLSWLSTVRAGAASTCRLTGPGYVETESIVAVPATDTTWDPGMPHTQDHFEFVRNNDTDWVFPFHARCWDLLQLQVDARLGSCSAGAGEIAQKLFQILSCTPWHGKTVDCGHDYGGASSYQRENAVVGGYSALLSPEYSYLITDPSHSIENSPQSSRLRDVFEARIRNVENPGDDSFSRLPEELLCLILAYLDSRDLCSLRHSSRSVAVISAPMQLPQTSGRPALMQIAKWDSLLRASRSESEGSTIDLQPHDSPAVAAELSCIDQSCGLVQAGTRLLTTHHLGFPSSPDDGVDIGVSFLRVNGRLYVSGLRLWHDKRDTPKYEVGVIVSAAEKIVHLHDCARLSGIEVSLTATGITGLRFLMSGADCYEENSVGQVAITDPDVGIASLRRTSQTKLLGFWVKFDACRLVSIALSEERIGCEIDRPDLTCAIDTDEKSYQRRAAQPWFPTVPSPLTHIQSVRDQSRNQGQTFQLQMNIEFAADRRASSSLQRIVALLGCECVFLGLRFVYDDGVDKVFGSTCSKTSGGYIWNCHESSFLIDGAGGEEVTSVKVGTVELDCVSFSGYVELIPIPPLPGFSGVMEAPRGPEYRLVTLEPLPEFVLSGFVTTLSVFNRGFLTFGVQSRPRLPSDSQMPKRAPLLDPPRPLPENNPSAADPFGFSSSLGRNPVWTAASLQRVRVIYISAGASNRSRGSESISGLWLEYDGSARPEIVGQWIKESGKFEISDGTEIVEIAVWSSVKSRPCIGRPKMGHIVKLQFVLSNGQSFSFGNTVPEHTVQVTVRANLYEKLDTISWAFGHLYDFVRVTYSQQPCDDENVHLKLEEFHDYPWVVPEKIFCSKADSSKGTNSEHAIAIEISKTQSGISGLAFRYASHTLAMIGCPSEQLETLYLCDGDRLSKMEMTWTNEIAANILKTLTLHTIKGQIMTITGWKPPSPPRVPAIPHLPPPPPGPASVPPPSTVLMSAEPPTDPPFRPVRNTVFILDPSQVGSFHPEADRIVEFPEGAKEFVGFWGVTRRHMTTLSSLGSIFRY
ncbi:hypothetical protein EJ08DRAFT_655471 [Tothia fuscella]|uniref:F-box domain-containing protein n=1 Tax=Tothia fuscella TaxID=1048955 RepID=A0A9P4P1G4_9PEZI|nr:hypothetical protein EJ08DRAFT_655471 [Tothia fuscella]